MRAIILAGKVHRVKTSSTLKVRKVTWKNSTDAERSVAYRELKDQGLFIRVDLGKKEWEVFGGALPVPKDPHHGSCYVDFRYA